MRRQGRVVRRMRSRMIDELAIRLDRVGGAQHVPIAINDGGQPHSQLQDRGENIVKSLIPTICLVYPFTMTQKGMINTKLDNKDMKMTAPPFRFRAAITSCRYRV